MVASGNPFGESFYLIFDYFWCGIAVDHIAFFRSHLLCLDWHHTNRTAIQAMCMCMCGFCVHVVYICACVIYVLCMCGGGGISVGGCVFVSWHMWGGRMFMCLCVCVWMRVEVLFWGLHLYLFSINTCGCGSNIFIGGYIGSFICIVLE